MIVLDRYEENMAVLEIDGKTVSVEKIMIQDGVEEGTVLIFKDNMYLPDSEATKNRRKKIAALQEDLFE